MKKRISCVLAAMLSLTSLAFGACKDKSTTTTDYDKFYPDRQVNTYSFDIIGGGDVMGAVALISDSKNSAPSQTDIKLTQVAAGFLSKQMEE